MYINLFIPLHLTSLQEIVVTAKRNIHQRKKKKSAELHPHHPHLKTKNQTKMVKEVTTTTTIVTIIKTHPEERVVVAAVVENIQPRR